MTNMLSLCIGFTLTCGGALAQVPDVAAWRPDGPGIAQVPSPMPQFIQQDLGRSGSDRDRAPRGRRMNRDEDDDRAPGDGGRRAGPMSGGLPEGHPAMRPPMMGGGMMAAGGARFHLRKGDSEIDVRCPSDVRLSECIDAIGRVLDRVGAMGAGPGGQAPAPR